MLLDKIKTIEPKFTNTQAIGMACSNEYVPYLSVCLLSLVENSNPNKEYDIVIFENDISEYNKEILLNTYNKKNISLRFYNMNTIEFEKELAGIAHRYRTISYAILFIPEIFKNYSRILFTDCDLIFKGDVSELLSIDLEGKQACAISDLVMNILVNTENSDWKDYCLNELKLQNTNEYFNSGVMVYDIEECRKNNFTRKTIEIAKQPNRIFIQGILNKYFCGNIKYMDNKWNVDIIDIYNNKNFNLMTEQCQAMYFQSLTNPKVLHWAGVTKPWENPHEIFSYYWWELARKTPYYEILLERILHRELQEKIQILEEKCNKLFTENLLLQTQKYNNLVEADKQLKEYIFEKLFYLANYRKNLQSYWRYKLLSIIMPGKKREHYIKKKKIYREKVNIVNQIREDKNV